MIQLNRTAIKNLLTAAVIGLFASGCANTDSAPTHRWASSDAVNEAQYRSDHARCQSHANINDARRLDASSEAFAAYKQCMSTSGYELTAYRN